MKIKSIWTIAFLCCSYFTSWSQIKLQVNPNEVTSDISPQMWGIFFEDINFAAVGCIVEGHTLASRYQWKKTVDPKQERELSINRWNMEFPRRAAPDYFQPIGAVM